MISCMTAGRMRFVSPSGMGPVPLRLVAQDLEADGPRHSPLKPEMGSAQESPRTSTSDGMGYARRETLSRDPDEFRGGMVGLIVVILVASIIP